MDSTVNPTPPLAALGRTDRTVLGAAGAVVVGAVAGIIVGAWDVQPFALVMIVLGLIVGGVTYGLAAMDVAPAVRPYLPAARRVAASVAAAIAALAFVEFLGDLDDLEDTGGFVGLAIALVVALGAAAMVALTVRHEDEAHI